MRSSGGYGEKLGYKLPHAAKTKVSQLPIEKDIYVKQEEQFK